MIPATLYLLCSADLLHLFGQGVARGALLLLKNCTQGLRKASLQSNKAIHIWVSLFETAQRQELGVRQEREQLSSWMRAAASGCLEAALSEQCNEHLQ